MAKKEEKQPKQPILTISDACSAVEKKYGKGIIVTNQTEKVPCMIIPTGSLALDHALGVGGYPRGRIVEIFGTEGAGKTTLTLEAIASAQKNGGSAIFIDAEHSLDPEYARSIGVDMDKLLVSQPDSGEQVMDVAESFLRASVDMVVVDSVAALATEEELSKGPDEHTIGSQARLMSQSLRRLKSISKKAVIIFVNQIREKIGLMFGSPEVTPGGRALKFYASIRLDIRRKSPIKEDSAIVGHGATVKVIKNKVATPFRVADIAIRYGKGICKADELIDFAVKHDLMSLSGSWYSYDGERIGQGKHFAVAFMNEHPALMTQIENKIREILGLSGGEKSDDDGS